MIRIEDVRTDVLEQELEYRTVLRYRAQLLKARDNLARGLKAMQQINISGRGDHHLELACGQVKYGLDAVVSRIALEIPREVSL